MRRPNQTVMRVVYCPALRLRGGLQVGKTKLIVHYNEGTVGLPWKQLRPLLASAFRHVQREAFRTHRTEFIRRSCHWTSEITVGKAKRNWHGHSYGFYCRLFMGDLHTAPTRWDYPRYKNMPVIWVRDWQERLVQLAAHELWHRWEHGHGKGPETMCELVGDDAVHTYRREQGYTFAPPESNENTTTNTTGTAPSGLCECQTIQASCS